MVKALEELAEEEQKSPNFKVNSQTINRQIVQELDCNRRLVLPKKDSEK